MTTQRLPGPDRLRAVGIVFVVAIHVNAYLMPEITGPWYWVWQVVAQTAVPIFFFADGWLAARRMGPPPLFAEQLRRDAARLLVPWLVFSAGYLAERLAFEASGHANGPPALPDGWAGLPMALWTARAANQLYFLPALFIARVLTRPLLPLVRGRRYAGVLSAAILLCGWHMGLARLYPVPALGTDPLAAALNGLGFAALGWVFAAWTANTSRLILSTVLLAAIVMGWHPGAAPFLSQAACVLILAGLSNIPARARPAHSIEWLGRQTMPIYLLHGPIPIKIAATLVARLPIPVAVAFLAVEIAAIVMSLAAAAGARRLGLGRILFGERQRTRSSLPR